MLQPMSPIDHRPFEPTTERKTNRLLYCCAGIVAALTFPLIWLGGLVTTHDAGMAVPDWPGTFGYNLFLYPWTAWFYGPFDLFVEHGHRLLASLVGLLVIVLCVLTQRFETRGWAKTLAWALLAAVISQGLLGGVRVLLDARVVALIHGVGGPLVFALACFIVMTHTRDWRTSTPSISARGLGRIAKVLFVLSILQLVLGAHLRHALPTWQPGLFVSFVHTHLLFASLITLLILMSVAWVYLGAYRQTRSLRAPAWSLLFIVVLQVGLGLGTWVTNYGLPWPELNAFFANYVIAGKGFWESMIINGHQATGSLLIVCSLWLLCRVESRSQAGRRDLQTDSNPSESFIENVGHRPVVGATSS